MKLENIIYCGDNLTWLKKFPDPGELPGRQQVEYQETIQIN